MNKHPYLRAYLAGIAVPTVVLLFVVSAYTVFRYVYNVPVPVERIIMFPLAAVPNIWGLWNLIYVTFLAPKHASLGIFGGALPLILIPLGYLVTRLLDFPIPRGFLSLVPYGLPVAIIAYYLAWKYAVGFLNAELGVA